MNDGKEASRSALSKMSDFFKASFKKGELYREEMWLKSLLVDPKTKDVYQPQVLQGMWQAFGQMRSARTRGRYAVLATGVIGVGLFGYRLFLDGEKKKIEDANVKLAEKKKELERANVQLLAQEDKLGKQKLDIAERQQQLRKDREKYDELLISYEMQDGVLKAADSYVEELCQGDEKCLSTLEQVKEKALKSTRDRIFAEQNKAWNHQSKENAERINVVEKVIKNQM